MRSAEILAFSASAVREPSRYGERRRPNLFALAGALGIAGLFLSSLLTMNVISAQKDKSALKVIALLAPPEPPPPPPPPPRAEPVEQVMAPSPVVAPTPVVLAPTPPVRIVTSPTPPVVRVPGPPSPAPAPAPAVESAGDLSSTMISAVPPRYPHESRRRREQGTVVLAVLLGIEGAVADISVAQSSGFERLDHAALTAVRRWRWSPTLRGGAPVMVRGMVEIPFVLRER